ncbi:MAG: hypothetical protein ACP5UU_04935 [Thermoprotei archaeon]|jgi:hypothetical protein
MMKVRVTVLSLLLLLVASAGTYPVFGATINAVIYPKQGVAKVTYSVSRSFNLTYPSESPLSNMFSGKSGSEEVTSQGGPEEAGPLLASIREQDPNASIINYTLTYTLKYEGTQDYADVVENLTLTLWLANVTQINSSRLLVNLKWKAFALGGKWEVQWRGSPFNVNSRIPGFLVSNALLNSMMRGHGLHLGEVKALLDFSEFDQPLSQWHRSYNPITGITTFTKDYLANESVLFETTFNGQTYSLSFKQDPSAIITVYGYAVPSGDYLEITSAPITVYAPYAVAVLVFVAIIGIGITLVARHRSKK